jgi:CheY-like chemotaxis protein
MRKTTPVVLVIDDDPNDLMFIQSAFQAIGVAARVQTAGSGDEAIAYLTGGGKFSARSAYPYPDFVITDLKMPDGDGFAVLEHFKRNPEWAVIPTVILSGSQDNDDIKKAYLLGASAYHVKPSSPTALRALIKAMHDYWLTCELPEVDRSGKQVETSGAHKLGQRFAPERET